MFDFDHLRTLFIVSETITIYVWYPITAFSDTLISHMDFFNIHTSYYMYVTPTQIQYVDFPCLVLDLFILEGHHGGL